MLSRGKAQPVGPRETLFVAALRAGDQPDPEAYILSAPLLLAEAVALQAARDKDGPADDDLLDDDQTG